MNSEAGAPSLIVTPSPLIVAPSPLIVTRFAPAGAFVIKHVLDDWLKLRQRRRYSHIHQNGHSEPYALEASPGYK